MNTSKRPLLSRSDSWWFYLLMALACLGGPLPIIFGFAALVHYFGGVPWPSLWGDMEGLAGIYAGLVASITLLFGISSLVKSRRDKAWDDQFQVQLCLYQLNREWVEDEIRLLGMEAGSQTRQLIEAAKKPDSEGLARAYKTMIASGVSLREMSRSRARVALEWQLEGADPMTNRVNGKSNQLSSRSGSGYKEGLRVFLKNKPEKLDSMLSSWRTRGFDVSLSEKSDRTGFLLGLGTGLRGAPVEILRDFCALGVSVGNNIIYYSASHRQALKISLDGGGNYIIRVDGDRPFIFDKNGVSDEWNKQGSPYSLAII